MASLLSLDNTRDMLKDLVALADSVNPTGQVAVGTSSNNVSDLLDSPSASDSPIVEAPTAEQDTVEASSKEMTDDMLIDSLDLSDA